MDFLIDKEFKDIREKEAEVIKARREQCKSGDDLSDLFGIALSGGGIRSATINAGILKILNECGVLRLADYLSTVSGGGYIGGYIHSKLKENESETDPFKELFTDTNRAANADDKAKDDDKSDITYLRNHGYYLAPGKNYIIRILNKFRLAGTFLFSLLMNWIGVFSLLFTAYFGVRLFISLTGQNFWNVCGWVLLITIAATIFVHFFLHCLRFLKTWSYIYYLEGILMLAIVIYGAYKITGCCLIIPLSNLLPVLCGTLIRITEYPFYSLLISAGILFLTGYFANPNILTMHGFYRDRIAEAYLEGANQKKRDFKLSELKPKEKNKIWGNAPYPLINTCLNVLDKEDDNFQGTKTCDYFLFSPFYCGSVLTGYAPTGNWGYHNMKLSTAMAISGAALNPAMGLHSNRVLAFFMTLFNLRTGYWALNPKKGNFFKAFFTWWPYYNLLELWCKTNTIRWRVNVTDGGHIENLAIYELLRRRCKLIIAVDAGADPKYSFSDLENLVIRARNELGFAVEFRNGLDKEKDIRPKPLEELCNAEGLDPETVIRPRPSGGFSFSHFSIADVYELAGHKKEDKTGETEKIHIGLLVYVKASMRASTKYRKTDKTDNILYKTYHPSFPHEPTANQFFDEAQWEAYYNLGRFIAGDMMQIKVKEEIPIRCRANTIKELYERFDKINNKTDMGNYLAFM